MSTASPEIIIDNTAPKSTEKPETKAPSLLERLIAYESEVLSAPDRRTLKHIAVNKSRILLPFGHAFLCTRNGNSFKIEAVSNQAVVNSQTPFIQWLRTTLKGQAAMLKKTQAKNKAAHQDAERKGSFDNHYLFTLKSRRADDDFDYPFVHACWQSFGPGAQAGLLFTRDTPFEETELPVLERIARITGLGWAARAKHKKAKWTPRKKTLATGTAMLALIMLAFPVHVTTMAPAEVVAAQPYIVTAPMDGVIERMLVKPGTFVKKGTLLAVLNDTNYRNEYQVSGEEERVAGARYRQAALSAFVDEKAKRELAGAKAEQALAGARQDYAKDRLSKTRLIASRDGIVIYTDEKDWVGRPVAIGEKIMQIADPNRVLLRLATPIADSDVLRGGARVRMFLDADPLRPLEAKIIQANAYASPQPDGTLAYIARAELAGERTPRIGGRGIAKIYGPKAPLGYWLARRPIVALRQRFGF